LFSLDFGFGLVRSAIGLKKSRHRVIQSEMKPAPIVSRSQTFSRASRLLLLLLLLLLIFNFLTKT